MQEIYEKPGPVPVVHDCEVCVVGGSCTGVFAALRAARLGARVALIENNGFLGGVATAGLVNVWHSLNDTAEQRQIIGGLTAEVIERLEKRDAAIMDRSAPRSFNAFNSAELVLELDEMVREQPAIRPFLHARFVKPIVEDGRVTHAVIEDKSGRRAVRAACFVDATGDGDLIARMGLPFTRREDLQPPTTCVVLRGLDAIARRNPGFKLSDAVYDARYPNALAKGFLWSAPVPGAPGLRMVAGTRVSGADCSDADVLTRAEMEGRRQVRAIRDIVHDRFEGGGEVAVVSLPSYIGIREARHATCLHRLTGAEVLEGVRFPDAIANGSYRVDIHHSGRPGLTMRYLDGAEEYIVPGEPTVRTRWRDERDEDPTFYQIPYRSLVPEGALNVLVAGRLIDADPVAYGAVRVMVNCNQTGEAAGVASVLAVDRKVEVAHVDARNLRAELEGQGSIIV